MADVFVSTVNLDFVAPTIENRVPAPGAVDVALATNISFSVLDEELGSGVDVATIDASVGGVPALVGGVFQAGFTGSITPVTDGYDVVIDPDADFAWNDVVSVTASASDLAANASGPVTWSFAAPSDVTAPEIVNLFPAPGAVDVPFGTNISFSAVDETDGSGIDLGSINASIDGVPALVGGVFQAGFTGSITPVDSGYDVVIDPDADLTWNDVVSVTASASDLSNPANASGPVTWSFAAPSDVLSLDVINFFPADEGVDVLTSTAISFTVLDDEGGSGVDVTTLVVKVNGVDVIVDGVFQAGYDGSISPSGNGYDVLVVPESGLEYETVYAVAVTADDLAGNPGSGSWSFTTEGARPSVITIVEPDDGAVDVVLTPWIVFDVTHPDTVVLAGDVDAQVNGVPALAAGTAAPGFYVAVEPIESGLRFSVQLLATLPFSSIQEVSVQSSVRDVDVELTWSFTTGSAEPPVIAVVEPADGAVGVQTRPWIVFDVTHADYVVEAGGVSAQVNGEPALIEGVAADGFEAFYDTVNEGLRFSVRGRSLFKMNSLQQVSAQASVDTGVPVNPPTPPALAPVIDAIGLGEMTVGLDVEFQVTYVAGDGPGPYVFGFAAHGAAPPSWMSISADGLITGTPDADGPFSGVIVSLFDGWFTVYREIDAFEVVAVEYTT